MTHQEWVDMHETADRSMCLVIYATAAIALILLTGLGYVAYRLFL